MCIYDIYTKIKLSQGRMICHLVKTVSQGIHCAEHVSLIVHQERSLKCNLVCNTFLSWNKGIVQPLEQWQLQTAVNYSTREANGKPNPSLSESTATTADHKAYLSITHTQA